MIPLPLLFALAPMVPHIVMGVERLFGHSTGTQKKAAAMAMVGDAVNLGNGVAQLLPTNGADSDTMEYIDNLIEATVRLFNKKGIFTHAPGKTA